MWPWNVRSYVAAVFFNLIQFWGHISISTSIVICVLHIIIGVTKTTTAIRISSWVTEFLIYFRLSKRKFLFQSFEKADAGASGWSAGGAYSSSVFVGFIFFAIGYFFTCVVLMLFLMSFFLLSIRIEIRSLFHFLPHFSLFSLRRWILSCQIYRIYSSIFAPVSCILSSELFSFCVVWIFIIWGITSWWRFI